MPASYQEGDWVLVHHSRLPAWPRSTSEDPYFEPYKILSVDGHRITVRCFPGRVPVGGRPRDAAVTRTGEQAGKALRSQGHQYARVM